MDSTRTTIRYVTLDNREEFKTFCHDKILRVEPLTSPPASILSAKINQRNFNVTWYQIEYHWPKYLARIVMPKGTFVAGRNGNNINKYNFVIYHHETNQLHFRQNVKDTLDLITIIGGDDKNLPTLIGDNLYSENKKILVNRLSSIT